jgi:hypothetical protein
VDIFKYTAKKNKKIKRADQILPEVYGTTLNNFYLAKQLQRRRFLETDQSETIIVNGGHIY